MTVLHAVENLMLELRHEGRDSFLKTHTAPFLLISPPSGSSAAQAEEWTQFNTDTFDIVNEDEAGNMEEAELDAAAKTGAGAKLLEITKSPDNPWRGRISLGRARNNDLTVPGQSVSKLHAHFTLEGDAVRLADAGSHNGTQVNGKMLTAGEVVELKPGDALKFGDVPAVFHTPASLCDLFAGLFD